MIYNDFVAFYRSIVLPLHSSHPGMKRLDGKNSGGSRDSAGQFEFQKKIWTVHTDTHFEPLRIAYEAFENGVVPFQLQETSRGLSLSLIADLKSKQSTTHKHMYIYSWQ